MDTGIIEGSVAASGELLVGLLNNKQQGEREDPSSGKAPVKRNLFGPVDHEPLQQEFQSVMHSRLEQAKQRWNFDFFRELPTAGLLQWEELQSHQVPTFYHTCIAKEARKPLQPMNRTVDQEAEAQDWGKGSKRPRLARKGAAKKPKQTYLTDYYASKKQNRTDLQTPIKKLAC